MDQRDSQYFERSLKGNATGMRHVDQYNHEVLKPIIAVLSVICSIPTVFKGVQCIKSIWCGDSGEANRHSNRPHQNHRR